MKTLFGFYRGNYKRLIISSVFFIIKSLPVLVMPIATANIIDAAASQNKNKIIINALILCVLVVQNIFTNYIHVIFYSKAIREVESNIRSALVQKLQQLSISYHNKTQSGRLQSKIMRDVEQIEMLSTELFVNGLNIFLNISVALGVVAVKNLTVFIFFLVTVPISVLIIAAFRGKIKNKNKSFRNAIEETSAKVMEMVELIPITRAHALENNEIYKMNKQLHKIAKKGYNLDVTQSYFSSISWVAFQLFQVGCLAFLGFLALYEKISIGEVVLYQSYFSSIVSQVSNVINQFPIIAKGLESVNSIGDILLEQDIEPNFGKEKITSLKGNIVFENVTFYYDDDKSHKILDNFNLTIKSGETVALVGGSGAGKTTVLNMVIGFLKPVSGRILLDGKDLNEIDLRSYRKYISVVPQNVVLFTGTIKENIEYGLYKADEEKLNKVLEAANLKEIIDDYPDGINTMVSEHGNNLSGGQKQRLAIARALIRNPQFILLDEATSALDNISENKIQTALNNLVKNRTTLIVAHRLSTIKNADKIVFLKNGRCIESGTYEELINLKGEFYKMQEQGG